MRKGLVEEVARFNYENKKTSAAFSAAYGELLRECPHEETVWCAEYSYEDYWGDGTFVCPETIKCVDCGQTDRFNKFPSRFKKMPGQKAMSSDTFDPLKGRWETGAAEMLEEDARAEAAAEADRLFWEEAAKRDIFPPS